MTERWSRAVVSPDMWVDSAEDPRRGWVRPVGEAQTHWHYLRTYRTTLEMKCDGLDAEQMAQRSVPPSTLSLLGLVRHLAGVEHHWFRRVLQGHDELERLYRLPDDADFDFTGARPDPAVVEEAWSTWRAETVAADAWFASQTDSDMGRTVEVHGEQRAVREVLEHLVEEYARHLGHADLLRERIDGRVGQ